VRRGPAPCLPERAGVPCGSVLSGLQGASPPFRAPGPLAEKRGAASGRVYAPILVSTARAFLRFSDTIVQAGCVLLIR